MTSANTSQKYVTEVNEKLSEFDKIALEIVDDSMKEIDKHHRKMNKLTTVSIQSGVSTDFVKLGEELGIEANDYYYVSGLANLVKAMKSGSGSIVSALDTSDKITQLAGKIYVLHKMTPKEYFKYVKTGKNKLTKAQLRSFDNALATSLYKVNTKTVKAHLKKYGKELFTKKRLKGLSNHLKPYGKGRTGIFLLKEFDRLYGLDKYKEFKSLTPLKKAGKLGTTFVDELVGKKVKGTKSTLKSTVNWINPKAAYKDDSKKAKGSTDKKNVIGKASKTTKVLGKSLGFLSFGIIAADNYQTYKGDKKKIVVGTAVDSALTGGAAAIGATIGTAIVPPIGTVVGAGMGVLVSVGLNAEWGVPPKSITDRTKDLANNAVDSALKSSKKIGKNIAGWFK